MRSRLRVLPFLGFTAIAFLTLGVSLPRTLLAQRGASEGSSQSAVSEYVTRALLQHYDVKPSDLSPRTLGPNPFGDVQCTPGDAVALCTGSVPASTERACRGTVVSLAGSMIATGVVAASGKTFHIDVTCAAHRVEMWIRPKSTPNAGQNALAQYDRGTGRHVYAKGRVPTAGAKPAGQPTPTAPPAPAPTAGSPHDEVTGAR